MKELKILNHGRSDMLNPMNDEEMNFITGGALIKYCVMRNCRLFFLLLIFNTLLVHSLSAQEIIGQVCNGRGEALAYANVILLTKTDSTFVSGSVTTDDGLFTLFNPNNASLDDCLIKVSCIGYKNIYMNPRMDMGIITLVEETQKLNEVVISGKRPVIQAHRGKILANIQHSMLANAGDAIHVLSMLPFINHTNEGISVIGRGTPLIYIDHLKINDISELQKISSNELKHVEIDLHPNASYGNEIKAVIKITTVRKNEGLSTNLTARGTQIKHFNYSGLGKLNYRMRKWDIFCGAGLQHNHMESSTDNLVNFQSESHSYMINQQLNNDVRNKPFNVNAGFNFSDNKKNDFGMKYDFTQTPSDRDDMIGISTYLEDNLMGNSEDVMLLSKNKKTAHALNAYYITSWGKASRLTMNADYLRGNTLSQYETVWTKERDVNSQNQSDYNLYTGKAEVQMPFWAGELHFGTELSFTKNVHSYSANQMASTALHESEDENRQRLWSFFVSQTKTFGGFSVEAGGRIEVADYQYVLDGQVNDEVSKKYKKLLPFVQIDYDKNDFSMSLSYRNYIHRPSYGQLNGSIIYVDKYTYQKGNPLLLSAYDYNLDFMLSWKDLMVDISHTWYENSLLRTTRKVEGVPAILYTTENIPHYREWNATVSYTPKIKFWRPKVEMSLFKQILSYHDKSYNAPYFSYEFDNLFQLTKHVNLSLDIWGTAAGNLYLTNFRPSFRTDMGLNTYLFQNKLAVWLKISDLFDTDKERWYSNINNIYVSKKRGLDTRGIMLQLRYTFNPQRSKYKGKGAGNDEKNRLK